MFKRIVKGFTLIELLIVIAIIGILAVAFLPSVLNAPAKGRDAARIAAVQKIQSALLNYNLEGKAYPATDAAGVDIEPNLVIEGDVTWSTQFLTDFGGSFPVDPQEGKFYKYVSPAGGYSFAVIAGMETFSAANAVCADVLSGKITPPSDGDGDVVKKTWCYAVLAE